MAVRLAQVPELQLPVPAPPLAGQGRLRKIGLLGSHQATLQHAPWHDRTWELWGHASSRTYYDRQPERYFDLHPPQCWTKSNAKGTKYVKWLGRNTVPIFMQERFPEVPASVRYPKERILAECVRPYFTSHAAWMIALALSEGVTHLGFFGINYGKDAVPGADMEYATQRGSTEYWIGRAEALGVHLVFVEGSTLLADPVKLYGYESHDQDGKLVPDYTKRTWFRPDPSRALPTAAPQARGPDGLVAFPARLAETITREERDYDRPAWAQPHVDHTRTMADVNAEVAG